VANTTGATPAEIHSAANQHRTSSSTFQSQNTAVTNEVEGLKTTNKGDLMVKLDQLQDEWSQNVKKVTDKIDEMADYLDLVANTIQSEDSGSAGNVR